MSYSTTHISLSDEIRISYNCIRKGIQELSSFGPTTVDLFIPLLLLSTGFERILKILFCYNFHNENNRFPSQGEMKDKGHDIKVLIEYFIDTCEKFP